MLLNVKHTFYRPFRLVWEALPMHLIFFVLLVSFATKAEAETEKRMKVANSKMSHALEETPEMPPVEVVSEKTEPIQNGKNIALEQCRSKMLNKDIEKRFSSIQQKLENDFDQGIPHQLKKDLVRVRDDIDQLSAKLFDLEKKDPQEINHIVQLTINHLEKMISLIPKVNQLAPRVRDNFVVPFTNISSIKAEYQDCLMEATIADIENKSPASDSNESSSNIYRRLTRELEQMNQNLYRLQTTDIQRFISARANLLYRLEKYNKGKTTDLSFANKIPQILNGVHNEIEQLLPGLELSQNYRTIIQ